MTDEDFAKRWIRGLKLARQTEWAHVKDACVSPRLLKAAYDVKWPNRGVLFDIGKPAQVQVPHTDCTLWPEDTLPWEGDAGMFDAKYRTETVVALCKEARKRPDEVLPILADALEEAGCEDVDLLAMCRGRLKGVIAIILGHQPLVIPVERVTPLSMMAYLQGDCRLQKSVELLPNVKDAQLTHHLDQAKRQLTINVRFNLEDENRFPRTVSQTISHQEMAFGDPFGWRDLLKDMAGRFIQRVAAIATTPPGERDRPNETTP